MIILDTDVLSIIERADSPDAHRIKSRLAAMAPDDVAATIVSFEEQVRGWLSRLARGRSLADQIEAYRRLNRLRENYCTIRVLAFDEGAAIEFQRLRKSRLRVGTMDLKIAAIALARDATLVTRNRSDFGKVPGLRAEDWTTEPGSDA